MLRQRLIFGTLLTIAFLGVLALDAWLDGSLLPEQNRQPIQATLLAVLLILLAKPVQMEMAALARQSQTHIFLPVTVPAAAVISTAFYWSQFFTNRQEIRTLFLLLALPAAFAALFFAQVLRFGTQNALKNIAVSSFSILYLGLLPAFILAIRIHLDLRHLLIFIFTIKCSDIGAYTIGKLFGKHKLAPAISPGKTWQGLAGAVIFAAGLAYALNLFCGIMTSAWALAFGAAFGILGQLSDLAESMLKRDAGLKDSSARIPGFGGILDLIDSLLATAPAAYAFFLWYAFNAAKQVSG